MVDGRDARQPVKSYQTLLPDPGLQLITPWKAVRIRSKTLLPVDNLPTTTSGPMAPKEAQANRNLEESMSSLQVDGLLAGSYHAIGRAR
jgi:hypothetical protein